MGRFRQLDDLVVQLKGLVLVRKVLRERGTNVEEIDAEIVRVRERLAEKVRLTASDEVHLAA
jgi:hypothetical protein